MGAGASAADSSTIQTWSVEQVCEWVRGIWLNEFESKFREANVDGRKLLSLDDKNIGDVLKLDGAHASSILAYIQPLHEKQKAGKKAIPLKKGKAIGMGNFEMIKRIGKGAFGDVWMATMIQGDGQNHAIKVLDKAHIAQTDTLSNVLEEKKVLKMCHDPTPTPFIVQLKYAFQDEKKLYLVLSLVEGGDLYTNLDKQPSKCFDIETVRFYTAEILAALQWMHEKRIAYRDLKAENVLIGKDGHIVVTDMGLAKHWENPRDEMHSTSIVGTPEYMPPEVIREEGHGIAMDYWSLGVLSYEMTVGMTPFSSDDAKGLFVNILMHDPAFPASAPEDFRVFIRGLLHKEPSQRLGIAGGAEEARDADFFSKFDWAALMRKGITPPTVSISEMTHVQEDTHDNKMDEANFTDFEEYEQAPESVQVAEEKLQKGKEEVNDLKAQLEKEQDQIQDLGRRKSTLMEEVEDVKQTLEEREKQLDLIINLVPHMICAKNLEGKYLLANKAMSERYQMTPQELVGKNQIDLAKDKAEAQKMLDVDRQVIEDNRRQVNQFSLATELGGTKMAPRTLRVTKIPYKDNGEPAVLAIGEDITDLIETSRKHKERLDTMALENKLLKRKIDLLEQQLTYAKFRADNKEGQ